MGRELSYPESGTSALFHRISQFTARDAATESHPNKHLFQKVSWFTTRPDSPEDVRVEAPSLSGISFPFFKFRSKQLVWFIQGVCR